MKNDNNLKLWVLVIGVLAVFAVGTFIVTWSVQQSMQQAQQAIQPVSEMTNSLATEMARLLHPTPTVIPDPVTIINQVRSLARLETIEYSIEKVITAETRQEVFKRLFGDRLIFIAHGNVIAGVDLMKLGTDDMWRRDDVLYVRLPQPEVFVAALDNDKSYVYDRQTGLLTKGETNLETLARQSAEEEIEKAALEDGILEQARVNAETFLHRFLLNLGYHEIVFVEPEPTATP
jgi:cell division protein FtsB